jgi:hypothetical protein
MATVHPSDELRVRPPSQYEVEAPPPDVGVAEDDEMNVMVVDDGLGTAERELLWAVRDSIDRYEPIRASGSRLEIRWREGSVVLTGRVRSLPLKVMAERLGAAGAGGRPFVSEVIADADVVMAVATALALDARTSMAPVYVECSQGIVQLSGPAPAAMVQAAVEVARGVPGVVEVRNELVPVAVAAAAPTPAEEKADVGATSKPTADTAFTSEPRLEPHGRTQDADQVTRPQNGERVPIADV